MSGIKIGTGLVAPAPSLAARGDRAGELLRGLPRSEWVRPAGRVLAGVPWEAGPIDLSRVTAAELLGWLD